MKNKEVADILDRMGTLLEIKDENIFKIRAYHKAADNISALSEDIETVRAENRLAEIPGVGKALVEKISEYLDKGKMSAYEKLVKEVPETILDVVNIPSVGPKKAKLFYDELKVKSVGDLKKAAEQGRLLGLPGIQQKAVDNILQGIKVVAAGQERMNLGKATAVAEEIIGQLTKQKEVKRVSAAGSLRRCKETVRDIDILVESSEPAKTMEAFVSLPQVKKVNAHGETKSSILTGDNVQVDVRIVEPKSFGAALLYFTGSKNFNVKIRQIAQKKDMKVNEYGIFSVKNEREKYLAGKTEEECLEALGLAYIPPELREDIGEKDLFSGKKPPRLVELKDIKGEIHVHSTWSDGKNTIEEMAAKAEELGYGYLAISDHSARLKIAGGVSPEDLLKKKKEIDGLNKKLKGFRILFGTEVEIDSEGNLDYDEKILSGFDVVVASVHTGFEQPKQRLTSRIVRACQNKYVTAIGHPTGVHLGKREPYDVDFKEICKVAVETNTALEINAFPVRLDLNSSNAYYAREKGVKFVIDTDAHATRHMEYMRFGISIARRAWIEKSQVLNTLTVEKFLKAIKN